MQLFPPLQVGWLNGWIFIAALALTDAVVFALFPRDVVKRLFDRSGWPRRQVILTAVSKLFGLACIVLFCLTPLRVGKPVFYVGGILALWALVGLGAALFDFKRAPLDRPATHGLYTISRHPQIFMSSVVLLGACLAVGSWTALILLIIARAFGHASILAEEAVCLRKYGEPYRVYLKSVPRYFLFF